MSVFDWRKVNLLDLKLDADSSKKIVDVLEDATITCSASGQGQNIICDSAGRIHVFYHGWDCISFKGHEMSISLCALSTQNNLLVTVSGKELHEVFKVWNLSKISKNDGAVCLRKVTIGLLQRPTALAIADNGQLMAIGYELGSISLYRGDVGRDNTKTLRKFKCSQTAIVGIAFQVQGKNVNMFVCSDSSIVVYSIRSKDKEIRSVLDDTFSPTTCCALQNYTESSNELNFIVGRDDAVYCFNTDGRGPCYVLDGKKSVVDWFRNNLIIISKAPKTTTNKQSLSVIDIQDKIIVFNCNIDDVAAIFKEFGTCYILTKQHELYCLCEKDLQSKLNALFKKNQYEVAVSIASRQQYDAEGLANIYKQYGDHLYIKRDYDGAVENYIKTIGYLEPSYVTQKFLDSKHIKHLTDYLLALHDHGQATSQHHTTLLLNCLTRLEIKNELRNFLTKDRNPDIMFDIDEAIQICRKSSVQLALDLAKKHKKHDHCISILIEEMNAYEEALNYISKLGAGEAESLLLKYGIFLMNKHPDTTTNILKEFCTDRDSGIGILSDNREQSRSLEPEKFLKIFFRNPDKSIEFLEHIIENTNKRSPVILNTLIELYLFRWEQNASIEHRLMKILQNYDSDYDMNQALILCRLYNFTPGIVWIYEHNKLYILVLNHHLKHRNYDAMIKFCERNAPAEPSLWLHVLNGFKTDSNAPADFLISVLNNIEKYNYKTQPPLQILNYLVAEDKNIKLSNVRDYFLHVLRKETQMSSQDEVKVNNLHKNLEVIKENIDNLRSKPVEFRNTMCDACHQLLTMPAVYFMCKHAYHQECLHVYAENEKECKICHEKYSQLKDALNVKSESRNDHNAFHNTLTATKDPFSVVSTYFGYGLFNDFSLIKQNVEQPEPIAHDTKPPTMLSEAKLRLNEGHKQVTNAEIMIPKTEARMRTEESYKFANLIDKRPVPLPKKMSQKSDKISQSLSKPQSSNPFEIDDDEDEGNLVVNSTNPFEVDEQMENLAMRNKRSIESYNNDLNPFA